MHLSKKYIHKAIQVCGKNNVYTDYLKRITYGTDASFYKYIPQLIIKLESEKQVVEILKLSDECKVPVTFRAAGTSLSGQTVTNSVILLLPEDNWNKYEIYENGKYLKTQPGLLGKTANQVLKPYNRKIGPDPASINSAMIGGIASNNASGMSSGVVYNTYNTLKDIRLVLSDGAILDTSNEKSVERFRQTHRNLLERLILIKSKIIENQDLFDKIYKKYKIKNTTGYGMNSFIDYSDPIDILTHLIIGSEGTLAFISDLTIETVKIKQYKSGGLLFFENIESACNAAIQLNQLKVDAIELIDRNALKAIENDNSVADFIRNPDNSTTCLLVEFSEDTKEALRNYENEIIKILNNYKLNVPINFTSDVVELLKIWNVRKGIFPAVGGNRKPGTTVIIEDVAFNLENLPDAIKDLRKLLDEYNYEDSVIYGHANDGNVHFIFSENFENDDNISKYKNFMSDLSKLVVNKYNGSLKAEHGTGRNMAPFVAYEWGTEIYNLMKEIKQIFDPKNILNPGVIMNNDSDIFIKNIKPIPEAHPKIDKCIECGFCEINCLTNGLYLSARQRIIAFRETILLSQNKEFKKLKNLKKQFKNFAADTCAADGLCSVSCPVGIDTGMFIKDYKNIINERKHNCIAELIAKNFSIIAFFIRFALNFSYIISKIIGAKFMKNATKIVHDITGIPKWTKAFPKSHKIKKHNKKYKSNQKVVYFPSCINRNMGVASDDSSKETITDVAVKVLERAGFEIIYPENLSKLCCGTPWESKGYYKIADKKSAELEKELLKSSVQGKIPVLTDTSPCLYRMRKVMSKKLQIYEPVEFALEYLVQRLNIKKTNEAIALHSTCTTTKLGLKDKLLELGKICSKNAVIPQNTGCCGFAGDKGFTKPEINSWALRNLPKELNNIKIGYSNSRTCEIGLTDNSGIPYKSIFYLLDDVSKNKN